MIKLAGLDAFSRKLKQLSTALESLDGEIAALKFDPSDPMSIEAAIAQMEQAMDERVAAYAGNSMVDEIVGNMKETFREEIIAKAAEARLEANAEEDAR